MKTDAFDDLLEAAKAFRDAMLISPRHGADREEALLDALLLTQGAIQKAEASNDH